MMAPARSSLDVPKLWSAADEFALTDDDFEDFRVLILEHSGIALAPTKRSLLCSRLAKRLRHFGFATFAEYYDYVTQSDTEGTELRELINRVTTNKTEFFRESHHFEFLAEEVLAPLKVQALRGGPRKLRIWSAGCSTGEEPYSIAMMIAEILPALESWDIRVLASDIDTEVLATAGAGEYSAELVARVPANLRAHWFVAKVGDRSRSCIRPELKRLITFRQINLIEQPWPIQSQFDLIFCRNVTIYFNKEVQERLYRRFAALLRPNGYLIAGHSENLHWLGDLFHSVGNTVYQVATGPRTSLRPKTSLRAVAQKSLRVAARASVHAPPVLAAPAAPARTRVRIVSGEWRASLAPMELTTVLGSCVSVCLFDPQASVGGMNHFMLPSGSDQECFAARYGVHAMELLINGIMNLGGDRSRLVAKVFGAAEVIAGFRPESSVSKKNAVFVRKFLAAEGIEVRAEKLGGNQAQVVQFFTDTGKARLKLLGFAPPALLDDERQYAAGDRGWTARLDTPEPTLFWTRTR